MKILFVSSGTLYSDNNPFERGGAQSQIYGISKEMVKKGHEVYITGRLNYLAEFGYESIDGIQFVNIKLPKLPFFCKGHMYNTGSALLYSREVAKMIEQIDPDVISLNERFSAYFPSKLETPKIFTTHNPDAMDYYRTFAVENHRLNYLFFDAKKKVEESVMVNSDIIIALNKNIQNYLINKGFTNIRCIPNGVDAAKYTNKSDENFILYAGRLDRVKGITYLIEAFNQISNIYDTKLLIIGSGPYESQLKRLAKSLRIDNRVYFIPMVDKYKLRDYLSKCTVFVLPSLFETFGIVCIEAMASGKPVIASDIPGPNDIITNEYDGFLFERGNVDKLIQYLEICLLDKKLCQKIGENARTTVEKKYVFNKITQNYLYILRELCY